MRYRDLVSMRGRAVAWTAVAYVHAVARAVPTAARADDAAERRPAPAGPYPTCSGCIAAGSAVSAAGGAAGRVPRPRHEAFGDAVLKRQLADSLKTRQPCLGGYRSSGAFYIACGGVTARALQQLGEYGQ